MNTPLSTALRRVAPLLAAVGLALAWPTTATAAPATFDLVTPAEAQREAQAQRQTPLTRQLRRRDSTPATPPEIQVLAPSDGQALAAPVRIALSFKPAPGARVVPSTFRALYGVLKIDLTERLSRHATITESGVVVENAQMPDGQHRFLMRVADDRGNVGEQELRIRVGQAP